MKFGAVFSSRLLKVSVLDQTTSLPAYRVNLDTFSDTMLCFNNVNHEAVFRTAPATTCLLNIININFKRSGGQPIKK